MPIDPISAISLGITGAGLIGKLFSKSPEDERQERRAELRRRINELRKSTLAEHTKAIQAGVERINAATQAQAVSSRQAARRRATALGFSGEAESFILPAEGQVLERGSEARRGYETTAREIGAGLNQQFDQAELGAELDFAGRPIEPGLTDYLLEIGGAGFQFGQAQRQADLQEEYFNELAGQGKPLAAGIDFRGNATTPSPISVAEPSRRVTGSLGDPLFDTMREFQSTLPQLGRPELRKRKTRFVPQFPPPIGLY